MKLRLSQIETLKAVADSPLGDIDPKECALMLRTYDEAAKARLDRLHGRGLLERVNEGGRAIPLWRYRLTDEGREVLEQA